MITQETAERIWGCYREIKASEKLLADMQATKESCRENRHEPKLKDAFGRGQNLQLGIPSHASPV